MLLEKRKICGLLSSLLEVTIKKALFRGLFLNKVQRAYLQLEGRYFAKIDPPHVHTTCPAE